LLFATGFFGFASDFGADLAGFALAAGFETCGSLTEGLGPF
jgi:hypothetical protein